MILPTHFWLYEAAFGLQICATLFFFAYAFAPRRGLSLAATVGLAAAALLQGAFILNLASMQGVMLLSSGFGALCFWSFSLTCLVLWAEWRYQMGLLGAFLAPLSTLMMLMGIRFAKVDAQPLSGLADGWLALHVALAMISYACFSVAAGVAAAFLVQDRQLKRKLIGSLLYQLPALTVLEKLTAIFAQVGSSALGASVIVGFLWKRSLDLAPGFEDPKVQFGILVWMAYTAAIYLRMRGALRGRRFALLMLAFFGAIFFGYYLLNIYVGGHGVELRP